ncbi:MAG: PilZ domain-containing protein, partial [Candidatus Omnitrophota bacterium]
VRNYFCTVSKDLSAGGIKIFASEFLPKGNYLKVNINLIDRVVGVKTKVAWCNKERVTERYCAGLEFIEMNEENNQTISEFLSYIYNS